MSRAVDRSKGLVPQDIPLDEAAYLRQRSLRRAIAFFFIEYLRAEIDGGVSPILEVDDPALTTRIERACDVVRSVRQSYEGQW